MDCTGLISVIKCIVQIKNHERKLEVHEIRPRITSSIMMVFAYSRVRCQKTHRKITPNPCVTPTGLGYNHSKHVRASHLRNVYKVVLDAGNKNVYRTTEGWKGPVP